MRPFQHKILNNVLFLSKKLFGIKPPPLFSFSNSYDETPYHMFYECDRVFGFLDYTNYDSIFENNKYLSNHILSMFKLYV